MYVCPQNFLPLVEGKRFGQFQSNLPGIGPSWAALGKMTRRLLRCCQATGEKLQNSTHQMLRLHYIVFNRKWVNFGL